MSDKNIVVVQKVLEEISIAESLMRDTDLETLIVPAAHAPRSTFLERM